jgi:hypothetical protein
MMAAWTVVAILVAVGSFMRGDGEMAAWTAKWIWIDGTRGRGTRDKGGRACRGTLLVCAQSF